VDYTYDALNQRIAKAVDPDGAGAQAATVTRFIYDRDHVAMEFTGSTTTRYLYGTGVDQILAQESNNGTTRTTTWHLTDHIGSVRELINNNGAIVNQFTYDSFGKVIGTMAGATVDTRYRYTGREFDGETGLYYYRARYYDANVGRFIGQDPLGFDSGDGSNFYAYVSNSPVDRIDPLGLYGVVKSQSRIIRYKDKNGTHHVPDIKQVVDARSQDPSLYIESDVTNAEIHFSTKDTGSKADRSKVVDLRSNDQAGHIIGRQLGGNGGNRNNLFAQAGRGYNQNPGSAWRTFENSVRANIDATYPDPTSLQCPPNNMHLTAFMQVNLWYKKTQPKSIETLRPIGLSASVVYLPLFLGFTKPVSIKNP
jgi:RHS repeat-associated protein